MARLFYVWVIAVATLFAAAYDASAQDKQSREREQIRRLQSLNSKLEQEKSGLAQQNATLTQEKTALEQSKSKQNMNVKSLQHRLAAAQTQLKQQEEKQAQAAAALDDLRGKNATQLEAIKKELAAVGEAQEAGAAQLQVRDQEAKRLQADLEQRLRRINSCEASNTKLYVYGTELLEKYEQKTCGDSLLQAEPFTGIKRVEIENIVEEYRDKLEAQKLPPPQR